MLLLKPGKIIKMLRLFTLLFNKGLKIDSFPEELAVKTEIETAVNRVGKSMCSRATLQVYLKTGYVVRGTRAVFQTYFLSKFSYFYFLATGTLTLLSNLLCLLSKKKKKLRVLKFYSKEAVELLVLMAVGYLVSAEY